MGSGTTSRATASYQQKPAGTEAVVKLRIWVIPVAIAVLLAAIVGGAVWLTQRGDGSSAHPQLLHLRSAGDTAVGTLSASSESAPGAQAYELTGTLPTGQPDDQTVWRLRRATADDARTLADALKLTGSPTRVEGGWVLRTGGDHRLAVRDDGSWSYGLDCAPDTPVASEDLTVGCAYATSTGTVTAEPKGAEPSTGTEPSPVPEPQPLVSPGPSEATARDVAQRVFDRLGLGDARVQVYAGDPFAIVQAAPSVGGLATVGWVTSLQIDGDGRVSSADGWLPDPERGAAYPVITAQRAFDLLQQQPRPAIELCMRRPDGKPGCADIPPAEVTGASLGLMLDYDGTKAVLVPAWLFSVKGQQEPATQIAVEPGYLAPPPTPTPEPLPVEPGSVEPGSSGGGTGGSTGTAPDAR